MRRFGALEAKMSTSSRMGLVVALGVLACQGVGAQERTYPGALCVEVDNGRPLNQRDKIARTSNGELFNLSSSHALEVMCPVSGLFNDSSGGSANVFVHDRHDQQDICCTARLNNVGAILSSDEVCSSGTDDRVQTLSMTPPDIGFTFTSRYFNCTIPPATGGDASGIRLYRY
jgi:hypothetical protein